MSDRERDNIVGSATRPGTRPAGGRDSRPDDRQLETGYQTLRSIAHRERRRNPSRTLNTTVLIHEAWLKPVGDREFNDTRQCLGTYAIAIRQVLVDHIRNPTALKRSPDSDFERFQIEQSGECTADELLEVDRALE